MLRIALNFECCLRKPVVTPETWQLTPDTRDLTPGI
jgi:hypothetical protein